MIRILWTRSPRAPSAMIRRSMTSAKTLNRSVLRTFHSTRPHCINPLLPFDVLEEVQNEDLEDENEKLTKQKKKLIREKKQYKKQIKKEEEEGSEEKGNAPVKSSEKLGEDDFKSKEDTVPLKRAVGVEVESTSVQTKLSGDQYSRLKEDAKERVRSIRGGGSASAAGSAGVGSGGNGNNNNGNNNNNNNNNNKDDEESENEADQKKRQEAEEADHKRNQEEASKEEEAKKKQEKEEREQEEAENAEFEEEEAPKNKVKEILSRIGRFLFKCLETIGITFSSVAILGVAGLLYHKFYSVHVLDKIDQAFEKGDPAYQLAIHKKTNKHGEHFNCDGEDIAKYWVQRPQQHLLDDIVSGKIVGRYYLMVGEKGTGKTTLLLESMKKIDGQNVAIFDAHADPEIFRIRLGKALNFAYSEDYIGSLFSIRGPRDTTALLDIERAFSKLEELAIKRRMNPNKPQKPLIMIINNAHLIKENEEGIKLVELLQQKAESLSGSGLVTMIFNSDDYWVYEKLKKLGTRLELINVRDFSRIEMVSALRFTREKFFPSEKFPELVLDDNTCHKIYDLIGGRPQHISQVARHKDIIRASHEIIDREKTWLLNQCGLLGANMDDDVMESGKFSSSCMLLMREFVAMDRRRETKSIIVNNNCAKDWQDHHLPELPLWRARQIMTRADYIQHYDNLNIFTLDSESRVRADSVPMMRAFHEVASQPHFDELLEDTIIRVADIESLGRTREIVAKDLMLGSQYEIIKKSDANIAFGVKKSQKSVDLHGLEGESPEIGDIKDDEDEDELFLEDIHRKDIKKWWKKRMGRFDESSLPVKVDENDIDINRTNGK